MTDQVLLAGMPLPLFEYLQEQFRLSGFTAAYAATAQEAVRLFADKPWLLLALALPEDQKELRLPLLTSLRRSRPVPIVLLVEDWEEQERVEMLRNGADVCLSLKIDRSLIYAQIAAVLRRYTLYNRYDISQPDASVLHRGELVIDPIRHRLTLAGNEVRLRRREFRLLLYFAENPGIVLTPEKICETVWMTESPYNRDVSAVIAELRKKLRDNSKHPVYIETVHGVGYRFLPHK